MKKKKIIEIIIFICIIVAIVGGVILAINAKSTEKNTSNTTATTTTSIIKLTDNTFMRKLDDIYTNYTKYENREITYEGFVYIDSGTLVVARMYNCYGTDSYLVGLECQYDGEIPTANEWVKVTGMIAITTDEETKEEYPYIKVSSLETMQERGNDRVY